MCNNELRRLKTRSSGRDEREYRRVIRFGLEDSAGVAVIIADLGSHPLIGLEEVGCRQVQSWLYCYGARPVTAAIQSPHVPIGLFNGPREQMGVKQRFTSNVSCQLVTKIRSPPNVSRK